MSINRGQTIGIPGLDGEQSSCPQVPVVYEMGIKSNQPLRADVKFNWTSEIGGENTYDRYDSIQQRVAVYAKARGGRSGGE